MAARSKAWEASSLAAARGRKESDGNACQKHQWSSGRIHRCHRCDPGSIPG